MILVQSFFLSAQFSEQYIEEGLASWYGGKFQGRKTANGEIFNTYKLTAAHKTFAFNSYIKVVNTRNSQWVIVRINDRGPFIKGRIIDLSKVGAEAIDMISHGVAPVKLYKSTKKAYLDQFESKKDKDNKKQQEEIDFSSYYHKIETGQFRIQIGSFKKEENAVEVMKSLINAGFEGKFEKGPLSFIRVLVINLENKEDLARASSTLSSLGFSNSLIKKVKKP